MEDIGPERASRVQGALWIGGPPLGGAHGAPARYRFVQQTFRDRRCRKRAAVCLAVTLPRHGCCMFIEAHAAVLPQRGSLDAHGSHVRLRQAPLVPFFGA